jgi:ubiquinone/menaquinone biosynthesis C-methylase UbiE
VQDDEQDVHFVRYCTHHQFLFFHLTLASLHLKQNRCSFSYDCPEKPQKNPRSSVGPKEDDVTETKMANMAKTMDHNRTPDTAGWVLHSAALYDLLLWLVCLGREGDFREKVLRLARLEPAQSVLDVGCGTGTLAIAAKRLVGPTGTVCGIDASPEMIARANRKARKTGAEIVFENGLAEALPFPNAHFDVVLSTVMLHHLPLKTRQLCAREIRRVLKPGGRVLVVDFGGVAQEQKTIFGRLHRHGYVKLRDIITVLDEAGLNSVESGAVGISDLQFVLAAAPCCG